jgi:RNA polymerase sigma-70 factor (ECF subfamily)
LPAILTAVVKDRTTDWERVARLVERARFGDSEAFRSLLEEHRTAVSSTLFACGVRCPETVRDLAQDVALRAWQNLSRLKDSRTFPAWIRRIAANAARDHLRRQSVRKEDALETAVHVESDDDPHQQAERVSELRLMLAALEDEDPEVVDLLVARADGTAVGELAERMELSEGALKMRLMRVRKRVRKRLDALRRGG